MGDNDFYRSYYKLTESNLEVIMGYWEVKRGNKEMIEGNLEGNIFHIYIFYEKNVILFVVLDQVKYRFESPTVSKSILFIKLPPKG